MNEIEYEFVKKAIELGYAVLNTGWPDFLITKDGVTQGVEVKGPNDTLKKNQMRMLNALANGGIECWVYRGEWHTPDIVKELQKEENILDQIMKHYEWKLRRIERKINEIREAIFQLEASKQKLSDLHYGYNIRSLLDTVTDITEEQPNKTVLRLIQRWHRLKKKRIVVEKKTLKECFKTKEKTIVVSETYDLRRLRELE